MKLFLDTHVAVAVYEGLRGHVSPAASDTMDRSSLFISPVVGMELQLLHEIGRLIHPSLIVSGLASQGVRQSDESTADLLPFFARLSWTRDPFDSLIVATSMAHRAPLVTRDRRILANYAEAMN